MRVRLTITAGFSLVDVFQLFQNAGKNHQPGYMDNIHPNATGDAKIFDLVKNLFVWPASPSGSFPDWQQEPAYS
ncbi:hypothetical protein NQ122_26835 [Klebsiella pneumoniae]|nr:hypothetical protein [Klebsiella pneumoniae]